MDNEVMKRLGPCGLVCARCDDYAGGETQKLSSRLREHLNDYLRLAKVKQSV